MKKRLLKLRPSPLVRPQQFMGLVTPPWCSCGGSVHLDSCKRAPAEKLCAECGHSGCDCAAEVKR